MNQAPEIVPASQHAVSRKTISNNALKVLERLHEGGYSSYLVGGGVRDALLESQPKDFDIATDASPEDVRALFRNSRIIGRRFRLVHVVFGRDIIEVATFRADHASGKGGETGSDGRILRDNVYGSIEEDALRRDFTVNALYFNIADNTVVDFVGGLDDIEDGVFRLIGDPVQRCEEDPVRVLRAARLSAKLQFDIEQDTLDAMYDTAHMLENMPPARLFEEALKMFHGGYAVRSFHRLLEFDLFGYLFPQTNSRLRDEVAEGDQRGYEKQLIEAALKNTDSRVLRDQPVTPAYLLAFMQWGAVYECAQAFLKKGMSPSDAIWHAGDAVLPLQLKVTSIPKRFSAPMREIWSLQARLEQLPGNRALAVLENRRFRAAYDFLCLRARFDESLQDAADWWTRVQEVDAEEQEQMCNDKPVVTTHWGEPGGGSKRKRRARRSRGGRARTSKKSSNQNTSPGNK